MADSTYGIRSADSEPDARAHGIDDENTWVVRRRNVSKRDLEKANGRASDLDRIPIRNRNEVVLVPVSQIASIVAEGETLHIFTIENARHTINYRLKDIEKRLNPARFVRLGRGALVNVEMITKVILTPGGAHVAILANGQELPVSRLQTRTFRNRFLKL
jgi:two-component system LytT family response regulator